jgi:hypothetical protein
VFIQAYFPCGRLSFKRFLSIFFRNLADRFVGLLTAVVADNTVAATVAGLNQKLNFFKKSSKNVSKSVRKSQKNLRRK